MKKSLYISVLSVLASFAVVMLHTNGCFWEFSTEHYWFTANIIECVMYFAVPVFFMISGATLMDYRERYTTKEYFIKRIKKTLLPFVVWNIIALIYGVLRNRISLSEVSLVDLFEMMLNNQILGIYWFFISIFSVYLAIPLFSAIPKEKRKSIYIYLAVGGFCLNSLFPLIATVVGFSYNHELQIGVVSQYLMYVVVGYLLHEYECNRSWRFIIYFFGIIGLVVHLAGTYILSVDAGNIVSTFKGYNNVPCILYSVAIFVFVKQFVKRVESGTLIQLVAKLNKYTFAVYLMHWFVMDIMISVFDINVRTIQYRVGAPIIIFVICVLITKLVRMIPTGKHILP